MKMWKSKSWQLEVTGVDGNTHLFGVNIFDYDWVDTKKRIQVSDLSYDVPVYVVKINDIINCRIPGLDSVKRKKAIDTFNIINDKKPIKNYTLNIN